MSHSNVKNEDSHPPQKPANIQSRSLLDFMIDESAAKAPIATGDKLLGDLVLENSLVVITGDNMEANSFLASWIGLTVAGGRQIYGFANGAGVPVLYLNGSFTESDFRQRLDVILGKGFHLKKTKNNFHVLSIEEYPTASGHFLDEMAGQWIIQNDLERIRGNDWESPALLLIIDDSFSWVGGGSTYSASLLRFVSWLQKAQRRNIAVVVIDSSSNGRAYTGTNALHRAADTVIRVDSISKSIISLKKQKQIANAEQDGGKYYAEGFVANKNPVTETVLKFSATNFNSAKSPNAVRTDYQLALRQDIQTFRVASLIVKMLNNDDLKNQRLLKAHQLVEQNNLTLEKAGEHKDVKMSKSALSKGFKALGLKVLNRPGQRTIGA